MAFIIKQDKSSITFEEIFQQNEKYIAFPTTDAVKFDQQALLPIGLLSYRQPDSDVEEQILIAMPNNQGIFDGDEPIITYSLRGEGWTLDQEHDPDYPLDEEYLEHYQQAQAFFNNKQSLIYNLDDEENTSLVPLFILGGQPPLGQNWDAEMYDEMGDNPELDHWHDVIDEGESHAEFEHMSTRQINYLDEESEKEYLYLGMFDYTPYFDGGGECIVFYQPELKQVMVIAEFS